ncbi:MAG: hypothetical protein PF483_16125 [Halothiobacillus sp.]|nr:hypothetical protein [Halothiobacillus sp.]
MIKKIKTDILLQGIRISDLNLLKEAFSVDVLEVVGNGTLARFLRTRDMVAEAGKIESINPAIGKFEKLQKINEVLSFDFNDEHLSRLVDGSLIQTTKEDIDKVSSESGRLQGLSATRLLN